jgi:diaminopimelate decarboxylase
MASRSVLRRRIQRLLQPAARQVAKKREDLPLETWRLARDASGALVRDGVRLASLVETHGSPLFVFDAARLDDNAARFRRVPAGRSAGVEPHYSYKTCPVPGVLARLHEHGVGAEVISEYELWLALRLGVPADRIVANGPGRTPAMLRRAIELGVLVQVNHREEIALLVELARGVGKRARVGLRVTPGQGWSGQFGEPIAEGRALAVYAEMARHPELELVAVHAHLGVEIADAWAIEGLARELVQTMAAVQGTLGVTLSVLDAGGSLACPTTSHPGARELRMNRSLGTDLLPRPPGDVLGIDGYVEALVRTVEEETARLRLPRPRILVEPGRAMTGDAAMLLCRVTSFKETGAPGVVHAILDAGINVAEPVRGEYHQIFVAGVPQDGEEVYRLVGPICTPMDTLVWAQRLPRLRVGDVLAIMDTGAYFVPFATSFSFPQPAIAMQRGEEVRIVRRAETFEDLVHRDAAR